MYLAFMVAASDECWRQVLSRDALRHVFKYLSLGACVIYRLDSVSSLLSHPCLSHAISSCCKDLKVYSNELFLFQLTNDLCRSFTKIVIIYF